MFQTPFLCSPEGVWVEVRELEERLVCMCDDVCDGEPVVCKGGGEGQMERG